MALPGETEEQRPQEEYAMKEKQRRQQEQDEENEQWSDTHTDFPKDPDEGNQQESNFGGK